MQVADFIQATDSKSLRALGAQDQTATLWIIKTHTHLFARQRVRRYYSLNKS